MKLFIKPAKQVLPLSFISIVRLLCFGAMREQTIHGLRPVEGWIVGNHNCMIPIVVSEFDSRTDGPNSRIGFSYLSWEGRIYGLIIWRATAPRPAASPGRVWEFGITDCFQCMVVEETVNDRLRKPPSYGGESSNSIAHDYSRHWDLKLRIQSRCNRWCDSRRRISTASTE